MQRILSDLKIGECATIVSFTDIPLSEKLMDMGCIPGETVKMEKLAPLGDPILISISGYQLSIRLSDASTVIISD